MRRYDLEIRLAPLQPDQARRLFVANCRHLGLGRPASADNQAAADLSNAAPGDFANAARQHSFQPFAGPAAFLAAVARECAAKTDTGGRRAGFH